MLTLKQVEEIREHLDKAQNPLFFFDNDNDGLISFLLLQRFIERGKGVVVKGGKGLGENYFRKTEELNPDYVFILDMPKVEDNFLKKVHEKGLPIVWIDHHNIDFKEVQEFLKKYSSLSYYNPFQNDKTNEPVSYLSYEITGNKKDIWLAMIGCVSDYYMPDFYDEFKKKYPELGLKDPKNPFDVLYNSEIGKIARILDFALKDTTTNVVNMMKFMMKVKEPIEILQENTKTQQILKRYEEINSHYQKLLEKARKSADKKLIYFQYGGDLSLSYNLSNRLKYDFPDKFIVVVYINKDIANISIRGDNAREVTLKAIEDIEGASGGGHEKATGARMNTDNLPKFKENVEKLIE
jgi:single-stranded DNA-specific DHH superfamily exonuclease